jgi:hypothetical protein
VALKEQRRRPAFARQPHDQVGPLGVLRDDPRIQAGAAQDAGDPLDARALISRRVGGVEADQPLQQLGGPVVERSMRVRRHDVRLRHHGLVQGDRSKRDRTRAAPKAPPARQHPERR